MLSPVHTCIHWRERVHHRGATAVTLYWRCYGLTFVQHAPVEAGDEWGRVYIQPGMGVPGPGAKFVFRGPHEIPLTDDMKRRMAFAIVRATGVSSPLPHEVEAALKEMENYEVVV